VPPDELQSRGWHPKYPGIRLKHSKVQEEPPVWIYSQTLPRYLAEYVDVPQGNIPNPWLLPLLEQWHLLELAVDAIDSAFQELLNLRATIKIAPSVETAGLLIPTAIPTLQRALQSLKGYPAQSYSPVFENRGSPDTAIEVDDFLDHFARDPLSTRCLSISDLPVYSSPFNPPKSLSQCPPTIPYSHQGAYPQVPQHDTSCVSYAHIGMSGTFSQVQPSTVSSSYQVHLHGTILYLMWPATHRNRSVAWLGALSKNGEICQGSLRAAIARLDDLEIFLGTRPLQTHYLRCGYYHATITISGGGTFVRPVLDKEALPFVLGETLLTFLEYTQLLYGMCSNEDELVPIGPALEHAVSALSGSFLSQEDLDPSRGCHSTDLTVAEVIQLPAANRLVSSLTEWATYLNNYPGPDRRKLLLTFSGVAQFVFLVCKTFELEVIQDPAAAASLNMLGQISAESDVRSP
jgi:hypothetical protein